MTLDTEKTIYVCTDASNGDVKILLPRNCKMEIHGLVLDDPSPESTDNSEYQLLKTEMNEHTFDI